MNNYEYCVSWVALDTGFSKPSVLDYGCGAGEIVSMLRIHNVDAFGCDVYYEAAHYEGPDFASMLTRGVIRKMTNDKIPFADEQFDCLINNQVHGCPVK